MKTCLKKGGVLAVVFLLSLLSLSPQAFARQRALVIGIDGCTGNQLHERVWKDHQAPNIEALMKKGKFTPCEGDRDPRCAKAHGGIRVNLLGSWVTASGWTSVTTGVDINKHKVIRNGHFFEKNLAWTSKDYPTFFSVLKNAGYQTAAGGVAAFLTIQSDGKVDPGAIDYECGAGHSSPLVSFDATSSCNLTHRFTTLNPGDDRDEKLVSWMSDMIDARDGQDADVIMGVIDKVDSAGHEYAFNSNPGYMGAITTADALVGKLIQHVEARVKDFHEDWIVILTSDHGGHKKIFGSGGGHDVILHQDEVVPFIVAEFSEKQTMLKEFHTPVRQMDTAATVLKWFGMDCPYCDGRAQGIQ